MSKPRNSLLNQRLISFFWILVGGGSLGLAYITQWMGFAPCTLCLWERVPYACLFVIGLIGLFPRAFSWKIEKILLFLAVSGSLALSIYHVGVEADLWTSFCAANGFTATTLADLEASLPLAPSPSCKEPAFSILGLSFAAWNMVWSGMLWSLSIALLKIKFPHDTSA